jgi:hypothetical protein
MKGGYSRDEAHWVVSVPLPAAFFAYFVLTSTSHRQPEMSQYKPVFALIDMILIEIHLIESRVYHGIWNLAKVAPFLTQFLKLIFMLLVGSLNIHLNSRQLDLLPSPPPSPT